MKKTIKHLVSAMAVVVFLFIAFGSDDTTSSSSKAQIECGYCSKSFDKGSGYNTLMRVINTPETDYSHYCSRRCAEDFLRNN